MDSMNQIALLAVFGRSCWSLYLMQPAEPPQSSAARTSARPLVRQAAQMTRWPRAGAATLLGCALMLGPGVRHLHAPRA